MQHLTLIWHEALRAIGVNSKLIDLIESVYEQNQMLCHDQVYESYHSVILLICIYLNHQGFAQVYNYINLNIRF